MTNSHISYSMISDLRKIDNMIENMVYEMEVVSAEKLGLDPRAGMKIRVNSLFIVVEKDRRRNLDYYGGFEYCDSDTVKEYGDYVLYSRDSDRVDEALSRIEEFEEVSDDV